MFLATSRGNWYRYLRPFNNETNVCGYLMRTIVRVSKEGTRYTHRSALVQEYSRRALCVSVCFVPEGGNILDRYRYRLSRQCPFIVTRTGIDRLFLTAWKSALTRWISAVNVLLFTVIFLTTLNGVKWLFSRK